MAEIRLAANVIQPGGIDIAFAHLQLVLVEGATQTEIEVQAPQTVFLGNFTYEGPRNHTDPDHTSVFGDSDTLDIRYGAIDLNLDGRSTQQVWDLLLSIHEDFENSSTNIGYDIFQNSNSYISTLMWMVGIPLTETMVDQVTPSLLNNPDDPIPRFPFPGIETNVAVIDFNLELTEENDILRTGLGEDVISGGGGADKISTGAGDDRLSGGEGSDTLDGGADYDIVDYSEEDAIVANIQYVNENVNSGVVPLDADRTERDRLIDIEEIIGSGDDDRFNVRNFDGTVEMLDGGSQSSSSRTDGLGDLLSLAALSAPSTPFGTEIPFVIEYLEETGVVLGGGVELMEFRNFESFRGSKTNDTFILQADRTFFVNGDDGDDIVDFSESASGVLDETRFRNVESIEGSEFNDFIRSGAGDTTVRGGLGEDEIRGGRGDDILHGGDQTDRIWGGADNDELYGDDAVDYLRGGLGNDLLVGGSEADYLFGGGGFDTYDLEGGDIIRDTDGAGQLQHGGVTLTGAEEDFTFDWGGEPGDTLTISSSDGLVATVRNFSSGDLGISLGEIVHLDTIDDDTFVGTEGVVDRFVFDLQPTSFDGDVPLGFDTDTIQGFIVGEDILDFRPYIQSEDQYRFYGETEFGYANQTGIVSDNDWMSSLSGFQGTTSIRVLSAPDAMIDFVRLEGVDRAAFDAFNTPEEAGILLELFADA